MTTLDDKDKADGGPRGGSVQTPASTAPTPFGINGEGAGRVMVSDVAAGRF